MDRPGRPGPTIVTLVLALVFVLVLVVAWGAVSAGGSGAPLAIGDEHRFVDPRTVVDDRGHALAADPPVRRLISLVPALTDAVVDLGASDRLVARTRYDHAPDLLGLPSVGEPANPDLEILLALRPDVVVVWADETGPRVAERLQEAGVRAYTARVMDFDDLRRHVRSLGSLLEREARADSLIEAFDRGLPAVPGRASPAGRPTMAFVVWPRPLSVAGPGTYVDRLIRSAGGENAFADAQARWPTVSAESFLARAPDILVFPVGDGGPDFPASIRDGLPWSALPAVRDGWVVRIPRNLVERPTLRSPEAVRILASHVRRWTRQATAEFSTDEPSTTEPPTVDPPTGEPSTEHPPIAPAGGRP